MNNWFTKNGKVLTIDGKIRGCCCGELALWALGYQTVGYIHRESILDPVDGVRLDVLDSKITVQSGSFYDTVLARTVCQNGRPTNSWASTITYTSYRIGIPFGAQSINIYKRVKGTPEELVYSLSLSTYTAAAVGTLFFSANDVSYQYYDMSPCDAYSGYMEVRKDYR